MKRMVRDEELEELYSLKVALKHQQPQELENHWEKRVILRKK